MKHRSPAAVFFLSLITLSIYALVWEVKTKGELNRQGADIPTAWLLIVPLANLYWIWKYANGVEKVSNGKISAVLTLILMLLLSIVGFAILQSEYNKLAEAPAPAGPAPFTPPVVAAVQSDPTSVSPFPQPTVNVVTDVMPSQTVAPTVVPTVSPGVPSAEPVTPPSDVPPTPPPAV